ncbi:hypothetical protein D3C78_1302710 [compost metagenome]
MAGPFHGFGLGCWVDHDLTKGFRGITQVVHAALQAVAGRCIFVYVHPQRRAALYLALMSMLPEKYPVITRAPLRAEPAVAEVEIDKCLGMKNDHWLEPFLG